MRQNNGEKRKLLMTKGMTKLLSSEDKTKSAAVAIILLLAVSAIIAIVPAFGSTLSSTTTLPGYKPVPDRETWTEVGVSPKLIGLGQEVLINLITYPAPSSPTYYVQSALNELTAGFVNGTVTINQPDGTKDTFMPIDGTLVNAGISIPGLYEIVGSLQFYYKPTQVGNYTVTGTFPGQFYTTDRYYKGMNLSVYYTPSSSTLRTTFTVQEDTVLGGVLNGWPWSPLPTAYWENPVMTDNREWSVISGPWPSVNYNQKVFANYNPYTTAPLSGHILWKSKPDSGTVAGSGLAGGIWGSISTSTAAGGAGNIVMDGNIYQNDLSGTTFECIDLRTGEVKWHANGTINGAYRVRAVPSRANIIDEAGLGEFLLGGISDNSVGTGSVTWTH